MLKLDMYTVRLKFRQLGWKMQAYKKRFAYWLIRSESRDFRDHISDLFECETDFKMGPNPIELRVLTGHNQHVNIINGRRKINIILMDQQVIVSCWAGVQIDGELEVVHPEKDRIGTHGFTIPYNPEHLRILYEAQKAGRWDESQYYGPR